MILSKEESKRVCSWAESWYEFHQWYECRKTHCVGEMVCCFKYDNGIPLTSNIEVITFNNKLINILVKVPIKRHWFLEGILGTKTDTYIIYPNEDGPWWKEVMTAIPKAENNLKNRWANENLKRQTKLNKISEKLYGNQ